MSTVKQVLKAKSDMTVHTIDAEASVYEAVAQMSRAEVGALVVMVGDAVCGIVTERDYARKVILQDKASRTTTVCEIMTAPVMAVRLGTNTDECMALMTENRLRHLPIINNEGKLIGMISIGDLVKDIISEQKFIIEQLEHYIRGER